MTTKYRREYNSRGYQIKAAGAGSVRRSPRQQQAIKQAGERPLAVAIQPAIEKAGVSSAHPL
jgi:hypothetical protein